MATSALESAATRPAGNDAAAVAADAAIARVLAAERDARAAVAECVLQAERELQAGRERARLIAARGADRAVRVQHSAERRLTQAAARIASERDALSRVAGDPVADERRLAVAVERLADELSRGTLTPPPAQERV